MTFFDVDQAGWGSRLVYDDGSWHPWNPDKWVVHWGGGTTLIAEGVAAEATTLRGWQRYHMNTKGWLDIAYNYAIGNSGTVYRLRGENRAGATRGDFEADGIPENHEARAVVFIINVGQAPSDLALAAFQRLYTADPLPVIGHKWVFEQGTGGTSTSCPCPDLDLWLHANGYEGDDEMTPEQETDLAWLREFIVSVTEGVDAEDEDGGPSGPTFPQHMIPWHRHGRSALEAAVANLTADLDTHGHAPLPHNHNSRYAASVHSHLYSDTNHRHRTEGNTI